MVVRVTSGHVAPNSGSFQQPTLDGQTDSGQTNANSRKQTDLATDAGLIFQGGAVDITRTEYVAYGNVYERPPEPEVVVVPDVYIESELYPVFWSDDMALTQFTLDGDMFPHFDSMSPASVILDGTLNSVLIEYTLWPAEDTVATSSLTGGTETIYLFTTYSNWPLEDTFSTSSLTGGANDIVLISYTNWPSESMSIGNQITGGTLV